MTERTKGHKIFLFENICVSGEKSIFGDIFITRVYLSSHIITSAYISNYFEIFLTSGVVYVGRGVCRNVILILGILNIIFTVTFEVKMGKVIEVKSEKKNLF